MAASHPMVGRDNQLGRVRAAWRSLRGRPAVVLVSGPAGIGKSRLIAEALHKLSPRPASVLHGGHPARVPRPYGWLTDAVPGAAPGGLDEAVSAVRSRLGTGPSVVIAEDLHELDPESLSLIAALAGVPEPPLLVVASCRDVPPQATTPELSRCLGHLSRNRMVRLALQPLSPHDVARMIETVSGRVPSGEAVRAVHRRTGGNPFWIGELLAAYGDDPDALTGDGVPAQLTLLVLARLAGEDPGTRDLAVAAALLGDEVPLARLAEVAGQVAYRSVDRLVALDLVSVRPGGRLRFRHALVREAIGAAAGVAESQRVHGRALAAARRRADDAAIAWHAGEAGRYDVAADAALRAARRTLDAGRPDSALRLARLGLHATGVGSGDPDIHRALTGLAALAADAGGAFGAAEAYARDWLGLCQGDGVADRRDRCAALRLLGGIQWHAGRVAEQWAHLDEAVAIAEALADPVEQLACLAARSQALLRAERHAECIATADAALTLADRAPAGSRTDRHAATLAGLLVDKGTAVAALGDATLAQRLLADARRAAERCADPVVLGRAVNNGLIAATRRDEDTAWRAYDEAVATLRRHRLERTGGKVARMGVDLAARHGDLARAWDIASARLPVETDPVERVILAAKAALLAVERGDRDEASRLVSRSRAEAATMDQAWTLTYPALAAVALAARHHGAARTRAALVAYRDCVAVGGHAQRPGRVAEAATWAMRGGVDATEVRAVVAACLPDGVPAGAGSVEFAAVAWLEAAVAEAAEDWVGAVADARRALDLGADLPAASRAAIHLIAAQCAHRAGDREAATGHAASAGALLARWPGWRQEEARRTAALVDADTSPLTAREAEIVGLLSTGRTNRQIARALGIAERTVAVHVTRAFAKIGAASRTEAALWHLRHDRPAPPGPVA